MSEPSTSSPFVFDVTAGKLSNRRPRAVDVRADRDRLLGRVVRAPARCSAPCSSGWLRNMTADSFSPSWIRTNSRRSPPSSASDRSRPSSACATAAYFDGFVGVQPEAVIRAWIERLMPSPAQRVLSEAARLEPTDPVAADEKYQIALSLDPNLSAGAHGPGSDRPAPKSSRRRSRTPSRAGTPGLSGTRRREGESSTHFAAPGPRSRCSQR